LVVPGPLGAITNISPGRPQEARQLRRRGRGRPQVHGGHRFENPAQDRRRPLRARRLGRCFEGILNPPLLLNLVRLSGMGGRKALAVRKPGNRHLRKLVDRFCPHFALAGSKGCGFEDRIGEERDAGTCNLLTVWFRFDAAQGEERRCHDHERAGCAVYERHCTIAEQRQYFRRRSTHREKD
jgi:hypothetical protein